MKKQTAKIISIIIKAGKILLNNDINTNKSANELDLIVDSFLFKELKKYFPNYQYISEESSSNEDINSKYCFIVDPIDGSYSYNIGNPNYCISIALLTNGIPSLGIIYTPARKEIFFSETRTESFILKDKQISKIHASKEDNTSKAKIVLSPKYQNNNEIKSIHSSEVDYIGSVALRICLTATGSYDLSIEKDANIWLWDICAAYCILRGAGMSIRNNNKDILKNNLSIKNKYSNFITANTKFAIAIDNTITKNKKKFLDQITKEYSINIKNISSINNGQMNQLWTIKTKNKEYILKNIQTNDINYEIDFILFLKKNNFKTPTVISTKNNKYYLSHSNKLFILFEKIYIISKKTTIAEYIKVLSNYLTIQNNYKIKKRINWDPLYDCQWIKTINNKEAEPELFKILNHYETKLKKIYPLLPQTLIHGDLKPENFITTEQGLFLIDFGNARQEIRILDIIHLASALAQKNDKLCIKTMNYIIKEINKKIPLTKEEKKSYLWVLIIHKITEFFFYTNKDIARAKNIKNEIKKLTKI